MKVENGKYSCQDCTGRTGGSHSVQGEFFFVNIYIYMTFNFMTNYYTNILYCIIIYQIALCPTCKFPVTGGEIEIDGNFTYFYIHELYANKLVNTV